MFHRGGRSLLVLVGVLAVLCSLGSARAAQRRTEKDASEKSGPAEELGKGKKIRVAVFPASSSGESWTDNITVATLEDALAQGGRFQLVSRAQLNAVLKEQGLANSDLADPSQAMQVGKMLSARYVIVGNCLSVTSSTTKVPSVTSRIPFGGIGAGREVSGEVKTKVQMQLIDIQSGEIKLSKSYDEKASKQAITSESSTGDAQKDGYQYCMARIAKRFTEEVGLSVPIEGLVVLVRGDRVALDIGANAAVKPGMVFEVYTEGEAIKNSAGEVLSYITSKRAVLRVSSVEPKLSWATVLKTFDDNEKEDPSPVISRIQRDYSVRQLPAGSDR